MEIGILTQILRRFTIYLQDLPYNLRLTTHTLLFFLATIDITLTIYNNIDNDSFNYIKWGRNKILKLGFILFAMNKYEWLLEGIKSFFFEVIEKGIRVSFFSSEFFENPSLLYSKGSDLANYIYDKGVFFWSASSWIYIFFYFFILIGFLIMTIQLIICWVEYYFLTGISIIFLPFGILDMGLTYYKNVFNVIMSSTIKIMVMNFWLLLSSVIINDIYKITKDEITLGRVGLAFGTIYVLVAVMKFLPSMTSGLLSGRPEINAGAAMAAATSAGIGLLSKAFHTVEGTKEAAKGAYEGYQKGKVAGSMAGSYIGGLAGPTGYAAGHVVGGYAGAIAGAIGGGSYSGVKYGFTKQGTSSSSKNNYENETKSNTNSSNNENKSTENVSKNTQYSETSSSSTNTTASSTSSSQSTTPTNNTSNTSKSTSDNNFAGVSATNNDFKMNNTGERKVKNNLPEWAKNDY